MAALLPEYQGRLELIYADPPFFTNKLFSARIGRGEDSRRPSEWLLAEGYTDHWVNLDAYLDFLYPRLVLMHQLLSNNGTLYLHLDWHADAYARLLLDEVFGRENFVNEIIWTYHGPSPIRRAFNRKHDTILMYAKSKEYIFNVDAIRQAYHPSTVKTFKSSPRAGFGKKPDLERGKVPEDWWYFPVVARLHNERTGYPTQKPEELLERILLASSNPGGMVADFFCGSGTFPVVAARHDRKFLAADISWRAIHTARSRLLNETSSPYGILHSGEFLLPEFNKDLLLNCSRENEVSLSSQEANLDYWEVDPNWDGSVFRSVAQARRPNRSTAIPIKIKLPVSADNLRVRAVTVDGQFIESGYQASNL